MQISTGPFDYSFLFKLAVSVHEFLPKSERQNLPAHADELVTSTIPPHSPSSLPPCRFCRGWGAVENPTNLRHLRNEGRHLKSHSG